MMENTNTRIRVRIGHLEAECEGTSEFILNEFNKLLNETIKSISNHETLFRDQDFDGQQSIDSDKTSILAQPISTTSIAAALKADSNKDLILAASAKLHFFDQIDVFKRKDILKEMQNATQYYKDTYSKNLSSAIDNLVKKQQLLETRKGEYSLHAIAKKRLEETITAFVKSPEQNQ